MVSRYYQSRMSYKIEYNIDINKVGAIGFSAGVEWQTLDEQAIFAFTFTEGEMTVACKSKDTSFQWDMELTTAPATPLPFLHIDSQTIQALYKDFTYQITCKQGTCVDTRKSGQESVLRLEPKNQTVTLGFKTK